MKSTEYNYSEILKKRLLELRGSEKTQKDVYNSLGFNINNYEAGTRSPRLDNMIALATYYDVSIDYLVGLSDIKKINISKQDQMVLNAIHSSPTHIKRAIYTLLQLYQLPLDEPEENQKSQLPKNVMTSIALETEASGA